jgi:hypothetical protein
MSLPDFINEPVLVLARTLPDGEVQPTAFTWRKRRYAIVTWGRQWEEPAGDTTWRCCLVGTSAGDTFELRCDEAAGRWLLARAWLRGGKV